MADYEFKSEAEAWVMIPLLKNNGTECVLNLRPLVLCKDCKHYSWHTDSCDHIGGIVSKYFFCADGERRTDDV